MSPKNWKKSSIIDSDLRLFKANIDHKIYTTRLLTEMGSMRAILLSYDSQNTQLTAFKFTGKAEQHLRFNWTKLVLQNKLLELSWVMRSDETIKLTYIELDF